MWSHLVLDRLMATPGHQSVVVAVGASSVVRSLVLTDCAGKDREGHFLGTLSGRTWPALPQSSELIDHPEHPNRRRGPANRYQRPRTEWVGSAREIRLGLGTESQDLSPAGNLGPGVLAGLELGSLLGGVGPGGEEARQRRSAEHHAVVEVGLPSQPGDPLGFGGEGT